MAFDAIGVTVMISGPGDTTEEVETVREVIATWNSEHSADLGVVFVPKHFSTNTVPFYQRDTDGQAVINKQVTNNSDVIVCLYKHKLGTPTPRNEASGTAEEADLGEAAGRPVHVYFWAGDALPMSIAGVPAAMKEWQRLESFRNQFHKNDRGLYGTFSSSDDLREQIRRALMDDARSFQKKRGSSDTAAPVPQPQVTLNVSVQGTVWHASDLTAILERLIERDIDKEREWAQEQKSQLPSSAALIANAMPGHSRPRTPKTDKHIEAWAKHVRARINTFDSDLAAVAGAPIRVEVDADALLERVEVEIEFVGVGGVDPSSKSWTDVWTPLHVPVEPFGHIRTPVWDPGSADGEWDRHGDNLLLTIRLDEVRRRTRPTVNDDTVVLMLPWSDEAPSEVGYTWRATAANVDTEWTGKGSIPLSGAVQPAFVTWLKSQRDK